MANHLIEQIEHYNRARKPELLSIKYAAMAENAYRFFRATNHLFYSGISQSQLPVDAPNAWLCGDLHIENFGSFRSDNELVYFDLNDFDDAVLGPVTWEIARMLASIFIGFSTLKIEEKRAVRMAELFLRTYLGTLIKGKAVTIETRNATGIVGDFLQKVGERPQRYLLKKRTLRRSDKIEILMSHQKHLKLAKDRRKQITSHVQQWLKEDERSPYNYKVIDAVFRVAGTSSLGLERYVILLRSENENGKEYVLVDMKESIAPTLQTHFGSLQPHWPTEAERIVAIQQRMQERCPALLSTCVFEGKSFLMQEMQPEEDNINFQLLANRYRDMYTVIDNMAMLTASAQLRSSGRQGSDNADALQAWATRFINSNDLINFCKQQSRKTESDYQYYCAQYWSGIIH